jgi:hypothetical protein
LILISETIIVSSYKDDLKLSSDVIELKTGNSIIGSPKPIMSVKEGNLGKRL